MLQPHHYNSKGNTVGCALRTAKTCQYGGLTILGVEGYKRLRNIFRKQ